MTYVRFSSLSFYPKSIIPHTPLSAPLQYLSRIRQTSPPPAQCPASTRQTWPAPFNIPIAYPANFPAPGSMPRKYPANFPAPGWGLDLLLLPFLVSRQEKGVLNQLPPKKLLLSGSDVRLRSKISSSSRAAAIATTSTARIIPTGTGPRKTIRTSNTKANIALSLLPTV